MKTITLTLYETSERLPDNGQGCFIFDFHAEHGWMASAFYHDGKFEEEWGKKCLMVNPALSERYPRGYFQYQSLPEPGKLIDFSVARKTPDEITHWMPWLPAQLIQALREFQEKKAKQEIREPSLLPVCVRCGRQPLPLGDNKPWVKISCEGIVCPECIAKKQDDPSL